MKTGMIDRIQDGRGEKKEVVVRKEFWILGDGEIRDETVISGTIAVSWKESWPDRREF